MDEAAVPPERAEPSPAASHEVVAVFDHVIGRQLRAVAELASAAADPDAALVAVVSHHATFVREKGEYLATWRQEFRNLPPEDAWRLRRMQRLYIEEWAQVVAAVRTDLSDAEARAAAHAALAVLHSVTEHQTGLPDETLTPLLTSMALAAVRGGAPAAGMPAGGRREDVMPW